MSLLWQLRNKRGYGPLDHCVATMPGGTRQFTWIFTWHSLLQQKTLLETLHNREGSAQMSRMQVPELIPGHNPHMPFCQHLHQELACCHWFSTHSLMSDSNLEYLKTWQLGYCKCKTRKGHSFTIIRLCDFSISRKGSLLPCQTLLLCLCFSLVSEIREFGKYM